MSYFEEKTHEVFTPQRDQVSLCLRNFVAGTGGGYSTFHMSMPIRRLKMEAQRWIAAKFWFLKTDCLLGLRTELFHDF